MPKQNSFYDHTTSNRMKFLIFICVVLSLCVFPRNGFPNFLDREDETFPRRAFGIELPDNKVLWNVPDMEYSVEEFENFKTIERKTLELGKQMIKLRNMLTEPQINDPQSEYIASDLLKNDFEEILLKENIHNPNNGNRNSAAVSSQIRKNMEKDMEKRWVYLTQRLVLDKALENLFTYYSLIYSPEEEFLSQEVLNKIESRFNGLGGIARSMSETVREELDFEKSEEILDSVANALFWTGLEVAEVSGERNRLQDELNEIVSELERASERERASIERRIMSLSDQILVTTMIIDDMLASSPWLYFLEEQVSYNDSTMLVQYIYNYARDNLEQNNSFDPIQLNLFTSTIKDLLRANIPLVQNRTKAFIEAILTDENKYIAPLMTSRVETLNIVNEILLEHEDKNNIPTLEDYKQTDYRIAKPFGMVANKFDGMTTNHIMQNLVASVLAGLFLREFQGVPDSDVKKASNVKNTWNFSNKLPSKKTTLGEGMRMIWGRGFEDQFARLGKGTVWVLGAGAILYTARSTARAVRRAEWNEYIPNARWAGVVSKSYATHAKLGYADLAVTALFDLIGTFTFARFIRFASIKELKKPWKRNKKPGADITPKAVIQTKTNIQAAAAKTQSISKVNRISESLRDLGMSSRIGAERLYRWAGSYLTQAAFVFGGMGVLIHLELGRLGRPGLGASIGNALRQGNSIPEKVVSIFTTLYDSALIVWNGSRSAKLNIITIGGVDATFIFLANKTIITPHVAVIYAGLSTIFELIGQTLTMETENKNDPYFSNQSEVSLHSTWADRMGWERVWGHLGFVSGFSITKFFAFHNPIRQGVLTGVTYAAHKHNLARFKRFVEDPNFQERLKQEIKDLNTGKMVSYEDLVKRINNKSNAGLGSLFGETRPLLHAVHKEIVMRQKTWLLIDTGGSAFSNLIGTGLFVTMVNDHLSRTRIEEKSLAPEIVKWANERLEEGGYDNLDHHQLNGLYEDISSDISLLRLLKREAQTAELSNLGYEVPDL